MKYYSPWARKLLLQPPGDFMPLNFSESTLYRDMFFTCLPIFYGHREEFCRDMVKGRKRQCKQKRVMYIFGIPVSRRTFLSSLRTCISTNKVINFKKVPNCYKFTQIIR